MDLECINKFELNTKLEYGSNFFFRFHPIRNVSSLIFPSQFPARAVPSTSKIADLEHTSRFHKSRFLYVSVDNLSETKS